MIRINPGTQAASDALSTHLAGHGPAPFKGDLKVHAHQLAILVRTGFKTWTDYKKSLRAKTEAWFKNFMDEKQGVHE